MALFMNLNLDCSPRQIVSFNRRFGIKTSTKFRDDEYEQIYEFKYKQINLIISEKYIHVLIF